MTTFVPGPLRRPVAPDSFIDITGPVAVVSFVGGVTFDAELTAEQVAAVKARIDSTGDADQAARAQLREAAAAGAVNLAEMHLAYTLADPIPDAVPPQT